MNGTHLHGQKAWRVRAVGDLVLAYHWYNDEPTMFIIPRYRKLRLTHGLKWALPLSAAHELVYADTRGHGVNTVELLAKAERCAKIIGLDGDRQAIFGICDLIMSGLVDLISMPPTPAAFAAEQEALGGTMALKVDGKTVIEREV